MPSGFKKSNRSVKSSDKRAAKPVSKKARGRPKTSRFRAHSVSGQPLSSPSNNSPYTKTRQATREMKKSAMATRKILPKPRRVPNRSIVNGEDTDDEPPSVIPEGYVNPYLLVKEGDEIEVWWEGDDIYYPGVVCDVRSDGKHCIEYNDGQVLYHFLHREVFVLAGKAREIFLARCFPADKDKHGANLDPVHYPDLFPFLEVGHCVEIYQQELKEWSPAIISGKSNEGVCSILYDDGTRQIRRMKYDTFRWLGESAAIAHARLMEKFLGEFN